MVQSGENIWTPRFQINLGLTLAGQIILGIIVYWLFEYSYARVALALTAFLLVCGISVLSFLQGPVARRILLGTGCFILLALLFFVAASNLPVATGPGQPARSFLAYTALILALLALLGKLATDRAVRIADMTYEQNSWFAGLAHLAMATIAGVELLLQIFSGSQIRQVPFNSIVYAGLSLNTITILLLGVIVVFSLISFTSPLTWLDGLIVLILSASCALFQYTFGVGELARLAPAMNQTLATNINLGLSIVPLALGVLAVIAERWRFITPLWLATQLLILQQFVTATPATRAQAGSSIQAGTDGNTLIGQLILYVLAVTLLLLVLRLLFYWHRRQLNWIDGVTATIIALAVGITAWSLGQNDLLQAQTAFRGNLLPTAYSLIIIAYVIGVCTILTLVLVGMYTFFSHDNPWLGRIENVVGILMVLSITLGTLFLLNSANDQGSYIAAMTLNPHVWNRSLPQIPIRNQYVLDALFVVLLLIYAFSLVRQRWNRTFAHTERALLFLSGFTCLLALASSGERTLLLLVTRNVQLLGVYSQAVFTAEGVAATAIFIAALISLLWLFRGRNNIDRIVLAILFGAAVLCIFAYYISTLPLFLLGSLLLLTAGILIATRIERVQTSPQTQNINQPSNETTVNSTL